MANEGESEGAPERPTTAWRPSRTPAHRSAQPAVEARIIERGDRGGPLRGLLRRLNTPLVKVAVGIGLFVTGAVALDTILDSGWAQKETPTKPNKHARGAGGG